MRANIMLFNLIKEKIFYETYEQSIGGNLRRRKEKKP